MSSSYVKYRGHGFWSFDPYLEHLLSLLADAARHVTDQEWLIGAREHWLNQASGNFAGWIHPMLDEYVTNEESRNILKSLLSTLTSNPGLTTEVRKTAQLLQSLVEGHLATDESSPLDYMVHGPQPYRWRDRA
jgi:hypothetical protein